MPHITKTEQDDLHNSNKPTKVGELCFLFAEGALQQYNSNPSWTAIHRIKVALTHPYHTEWSHLIIQKYMTGWSKVDIEAAASLAFFEFYRLIGAAYEDVKIKDNGDCFASALIPRTNSDLEETKRLRLAQLPPDGSTLPSLPIGVVITTSVKRKPGRPKKVVNAFAGQSQE